MAHLSLGREEKFAPCYGQGTFGTGLHIPYRPLAQSNLSHCSAGLDSQIGAESSRDLLEKELVQKAGKFHLRTFGRP